MAKIEFLTPVGRLVQGDPFQKRTTDFDGKPLLIRNGPNAGQPTQQYLCSLAISKTDPGLAPFYAQIVQAARAGFPQLFDAAGNCLHPTFAFKFTDGDGFDGSGKPNNQKEGFAGHYVFKFSSSFPPRVFRQGRYAPQDQLTEEHHRGEIRRGYYYRISGTMEANGNAQKPGVYLNLSMVELVALGDEITSGPDANAVFGGAGAPAALPAGARALPVAPAAGAIPGMPGNTMAAALPGSVAAPLTPMMPGQQLAPAGFAQTAAIALPGAAPVALAVAPNPAFTAAGPGGVVMPGTAMPLPGAMPVMAAAPAAPVMTAAAGGHSYDALIAGGWTEAALIQQGLMLPR